jgi:hypothetical protein
MSLGNAVIPGRSVVLSDRIGQSELRSRIRQEEKERREVIAFWIKDILVPGLSSVVGILGATIGVIALHNK